MSDPSFSSEVLESIWESDYDIGLIAGLGYHLEDWEISVRAIPGLARVSSEIILTDQNGGFLSEKRYGRNLVIQMAAGYRIN